MRSVEPGRLSACAGACSGGIFPCWPFRPVLFHTYCARRSVRTRMRRSWKILRPRSVPRYGNCISPSPRMVLRNGHTGGMGIAIYLYELCAEIQLAHIALSWGDASNRAVFLFVDNQAAVASLIKDSPTSELGGYLSTLSFCADPRPDARWWIEYVPTAANMADKPPRDFSAPLHGACPNRAGATPQSFDRIPPAGALHSESTRVVMRFEKGLCPSRKDLLICYEIARRKLTWGALLYRRFFPR